MLTALRETWVSLTCATVCISLAGGSLIAWFRLRAARLACQRERRGREEMEAYTRLDLRVSSRGDLKSLPRRVCSVVAARSPFGRVAMLTYTAENRLSIAATEGMDHATIDAIEAWLRRPQPRRDGIEYWDAVPELRLGTRSRVIHLDVSAEWTNGRAILIPIHEADQRFGALVVCADSILQIPRRLAEEAVIGLEALAIRLARELEHMPSELTPLHIANRAARNDDFSRMMISIAGRREEARTSIQKI